MATLHLVFVPLSVVTFYSLLFLQAVPSFSSFSTSPNARLKKERKTVMRKENNSNRRMRRYMYVFFSMMKKLSRNSCFKFQIYLSAFLSKLAIHGFRCVRRAIFLDLQWQLRCFLFGRFYFRFHRTKGLCNLKWNSIFGALKYLLSLL